MPLIKQYDSYKDSGIEWVREIPSHWKIIANKRVMHKEKRICAKWNKENIMSLTMNGVIIRDLNAGGKMPATFDGYQYVYPGELLMCLFDIDVTPRCVGRVFDEGVTSPAYSSFVLNDNADAGYFYYYYLMVDQTKELLHLAKNLRHSFTEEQFGLLKVPVPPLEEQKAIAEYLDVQLSKIEKTISDIQRSIEEYKRWKLSIIQETVFNGIRKHDEYYDTDMEWIDKIPVGWEICRLKNVFDMGKGLPITKDNLVEEGIPVISYGQIHAKYNPGTRLVPELMRYVSRQYLEDNSNSLVHEGDILVADTSEDRDGCGNAVYVDKEMELFAGYHTIILKAKQNKDNKYVAYLMRADAWRTQIRSKVSGVKLFSITKKILNGVSVVLPPIEEREEIVAYLDEKCNRIDDLIDEKARLINELERYKKSIVVEVVSGKRKVV